MLQNKQTVYLLLATTATLGLYFIALKGKVLERGGSESEANLLSSLSVEPNGFADLNKEPSLDHLMSIRSAGSQRRTRLMEMNRLIHLSLGRSDHILGHVKRSVAQPTYDAVMEYIRLRETRQ